MNEYLISQSLFLMASAFIAGLIDAIVGGGGLIQIPALFAIFPNTTPATLFGTNKLSSIGGSLAAAKQYIRVVKLPFKQMLIAGIFALIGAFLGALSVTHVPSTYVRMLLPVVLVGLLIFTLIKKDGGLAHNPRLKDKHSKFLLTLGVGAIGFYDGFFGPGTGSFLMFLFVHFLGFDFLHAAAATKILNSITNLAALALFIPTGHINWTVGLMMLVFNVLGSRIGSELALKNGSQLVRKVFIFIVLVLIVKTATDAFHFGLGTL